MDQRTSSDGKSSQPVEDAGLPLSSFWSELSLAGYVLLLAVVFFPIAVFILYSDQSLLFFLALFLNLLALSIYDLNSFRLPNLINLTFFCLAAVMAYVQPLYELSWHIFGALAGFLFPVILNFVYSRLRGRDGIGMGDAKLLAGSGMLLGWPELPLILSISSTLGLVYAVSKMRNKSRDQGHIYIPFGPFIAFTTLMLWLLK